MKNSIKAVILFFVITSAMSCKIAYRVLLGVDSTPEWSSDKDIVKKADKYGIPSQYNLVLDTISYKAGLKDIYKDLISKIDKDDRDSTKYYLTESWSDDSQPVQFRLFDKRGAEVFKIVNCYVDPPIPMNWNVDKSFDSFPPSIETKALNTHVYNMDFLLSNLRHIDGSKFNMDTLPNTEYYGVVLWNNFMIKPSRKLLKTVREKIIEPGHPVTMIYVNNHNEILWGYMDSKQKEYVKENLISDGN